MAKPRKCGFCPVSHQTVLSARGGDRNGYLGVWVTLPVPHVLWVISTTLEQPCLVCEAPILNKNINNRTFNAPQKCTLAFQIVPYTILLHSLFLFSCPTSLFLSLWKMTDLWLKWMCNSTPTRVLALATLKPEVVCECVLCIKGWVKN